jgi:hypothetical protein
MERSCYSNNMSQPNLVAIAQAHQSILQGHQVLAQEVPLLQNLPAVAGGNQLADLQLAVNQLGQQLNNRMQQMETGIQQLGARMQQLDARMQQMDARMQQMDAKADYAYVNLNYPKQIWLQQLRYLPYIVAAHPALKNLLCPLSMQRAASIRQIREWQLAGPRLLAAARPCS